MKNLFLLLLVSSAWGQSQPATQKPRPCLIVADNDQGDFLYRDSYGFTQPKDLLVLQLQYRPDHLTKLMQEGTVKIVVYDSKKETLSEARASCLVEVAEEHKQ
jgi:hypothetical protein